MTQIIGHVKDLSFTPGGSSQVYSSPAGTAQCFEQVFTQEADPHPRTEDWTNAVCEFTPSEWDQFSANVQLRTCRPRYSNNPLFRACEGKIDYRSARFPVEGVSADLDIYSKIAYNGGELCSAKTSGWMPLSSIVGTGEYSGKLSACVAVANAEFSGGSSYYDPSRPPQYYSSLEELRSSWAVGERIALKGTDYLSGQFIFRRTGMPILRQGLITGVPVLPVTASQVYSSTAGTACCYEQVFTQEADPQPGTMDWINTVCTFDPEDWDQFSASVYLSSEFPVHYSYWQGIFRAYFPPVGTGLSASLPVDGVQFTPHHTSVPTPESPSAWIGSAETNRWYPISSIAGSATGPMVAAVSIYNDYFNHSGMPDLSNQSACRAQAIEEFSAGIRTALSGDDYLSGQFIFRKTGLSAIGG